MKVGKDIVNQVRFLVLIPCTLDGFAHNQVLGDLSPKALAAVFDANVSWSDFASWSITFVPGTMNLVGRSFCVTLFEPRVSWLFAAIQNWGFLLRAVS